MIILFELKLKAKWSNIVDQQMQLWVWIRLIGCIIESIQSKTKEGLDGEWLSNWAISTIIYTCKHQSDINCVYNGV